MCARTWVFIALLSGSVWAGNEPRYTDSGELIRPTDYREWVFLTSGAGMTYGPAASMSQNMPPLFDNVFVSPEAYRSFVATGHWPDKTIFILEIRYSQSHGSINKGGSFQTDIAAMEAAVKDEERYPDKWAYFDFPAVGGTAAASAGPLPKRAGCYACHTANGAVENTFVQFYPTLLEVARAKGTIKASFKPWAPSPARVYHTVANQGWDAGKAALDEARADEPEALALREPALNRLAHAVAKRRKESGSCFRTRVRDQSASCVGKPRGQPVGSLRGCRTKRGCVEGGASRCGFAESGRLRSGGSARAPGESGA